MKKYFYAINEDQNGPFSLDEILTKNLDKDTLVWHEGLADWVRLSEIPELNIKKEASIPPPIRVNGSITRNKNSINFFFSIAFIVVALIAIGFFLYPKWNDGKEYGELLSGLNSNDSIQSKLEDERKYEVALSFYKRTDSIQFEVFNELAIKNHSKSNFILGIYYDQLGDPIKAKEFLEKAIVEGNGVPAMYQLYLVNSKDSIQYKNDIEKNFANWIDGISKSDWLSQLYAGRIYEFGAGVMPNSKKAIDFYDMASKNGSIRSNFFLGLIYMRVEEVQDYEKSLYYFKKAEELGFPEAAGRIGLIYFDGLGQEQNYNQAFFWHSKGAKMNDIYSQSQVAYLYYHGLGVEKNVDSALYWNQRVIDHNDPKRYNGVKNSSQVIQRFKNHAKEIAQHFDGNNQLKKSQTTSRNNSYKYQEKVVSGPQRFCGYCRKRKFLAYDERGYEGFTFLGKETEADPGFCSMECVENYRNN